MRPARVADSEEERNMPLVSVIVPAYNAEDTIDETLQNIRAQTYQNLEIIVVDDGSLDHTAEIVEHNRCADSRICLIQQANAGVAAARNCGIAVAHGEFVAPIDADDLWHPTKIKKQMDLITARGPKVGLVYTWVATIDEQGMIESNYQPCAEGQVLPQMCYGNLLGTASSALMRKQAILEAGGYDVSLRARNAQGFEDFKLYFAIAEHYEFAVVKEHLTGYRITDGNMSSDSLQMLASCDLVIQDFQKTHPHFKRKFREGRNAWLRRAVARAIKGGKLRSSAALMIKLFESDPRFALKSLVSMSFAFIFAPTQRTQKAIRSLRQKFNP
jgi:glycosyltransferase involved in cell wall biosynthesis